MSFKPQTQFQKYDLILNTGLGLSTLVVMVTAFFAAYYPLHAEYHRVQGEIVQLQDLIRQASQFSQQQQDLSNQLAKSEQLANDLTKRIPSAPRESDFLSQFCELAERTGLEVADYHPGQIEKRENHQEMEVHISTSGEYSALGKFLQEIDHLPRLCRLTQLDIASDSKTGRLQTEMQFRIYFAPPTSDAEEKKG